MMSTNKVQIQELHPGIFLYKKLLNAEQLSYLFELEVKDLVMVDF